MVNIHRSNCLKFFCAITIIYYLCNDFPFGGSVLTEERNIFMIAFTDA